MSRTPGAYIAYWIDTGSTLGGWPEGKRSTTSRKRSLDAAQGVWDRVGPEDSVEVKDLTGWRTQLDPKTATRVVIAFRDRVGFRWERNVGLDDWVGQADAAQILGVPLMRINRWVRGDKLHSKKRNGVSVVRVRDLYRLALELGLEVPRGRPLYVVGSARDDD